MIGKHWKDILVEDCDGQVTPAMIKSVELELNEQGVDIPALIVASVEASGHVIDMDTGIVVSCEELKPLG